MNPQQPSRSADAEPRPVAPNVNTLWARIIVDELARAGLRHVVISPGSRSAPLVFQFADHPDIEDLSIVDERSAAFAALGIARSTHRPVALVCTTGTAAANYFPAVCEAERDQVPLLILTGARPPEDHDCGVQQVMDQHHLYGTHVRAFRALPQPEVDAEKLTALRATIAQAWARSLAPEAGPVHLDIPFRKPLEPVEVDPGHPDHVPGALDHAAEVAVRGRPDGRPWIRIEHAPNPVDEEAASALIEALSNARRPLILAGADVRSPSNAAALDEFADRIGVPLLAEPASGLRHRRDRSSSIIATGELMAAAGFYQRFGPPDTVLHFGRAPLNWGVQRLLRETTTEVRLAVTDSAMLADPDHRIARQWVTDPAALFRRAASLAKPGTGTVSAWLSAHQRAQHDVALTLGQRFSEDQPLTAPGLWARMAKHLPAGTALVCSSSMVVRDLDCYLSPARQSLDIFFNRGLNGIDGVVSTATGVAAGRSQPGSTVLVIGDVALRHDLGALMLADELGLSLTVVVIDNNGGEIFDYLPTAGFGPIHQRHFVTERQRPLTDLLPRALRIEEPGTLDEFQARLVQALDRPGVQLVLCRTDRARDQSVRADLQETIGKIIDGLPAPGHLTSR